MAHGYLLASFLSPVSNTRNDEYGGDRKGRMRLPLEIVEAVRREMPATMPLFARVSSVDGAQNGWNMDDTVALGTRIEGARRRRGRLFFRRHFRFGDGSASAARARLPGALTPNGSARKSASPRWRSASSSKPQQAEAILEKGEADLIAVGRQSQFDPNIAHHWAHDLGINRKFEDWAAEYGWWLEKRIRTIEGFAAPTGAVRHR